MLYTKNGIIKNIKNIEVVKDGKRYFNPTEELILQDGWVKYTVTIKEPEIDKELLYKEKIVELIRVLYSVDDELAILRQRDTKIDEFNVYNAFAEECKQQARREIYGDELV